jgi:HSP90 family molecular chaperone
LQRRNEAYSAKFASLKDFFIDTFEKEVDKVSVSNVLEETTCLLSSGSYGNSANMERIMRAQAMGKTANHMKAKKNFEFNPRHPVLVKLLEMVEDGSEEKLTLGRDLAWMLFDAASLSSGFNIDDAEAYASRNSRILGSLMSIDSMELMPEIEVPEEEAVFSSEGGDEEEADVMAEEL